MDFYFDLRWHFGRMPGHEVEPQLFQLLLAIDEGGSIRVAAQICNVSYRHAWGLMHKWELLLGGPLVIMERGRGAKLTQLGKSLLWGQRKIAARLTAEFDSLASDINADLRRVINRELPAILKLVASHGLAISLLRELSVETATCKLDLQFRGSIECLQLLNSDKCDIAGFHFPEGDLARELAGRYRPFLNPDKHVLLHVVDRQQGLMTLAGNPKLIQGIPDLVNPNLRFINRQPNSGTRVLFDKLLERHHILPAEIPGYYVEEFTHLAVAAMVASGAADVSFGIHAAAAKFGLHFIPLIKEHYLFALKREKLDDPTVRELIQILKSSEYQSRAQALEGYSPQGAGEIIMVEDLISVY